MLLQDEDGQIQETHSVSAGLDYPGVGPEHALLHAVGRVRYETASDAEALEAVRRAARVRRHPAGARECACARRRCALGAGATRQARMLVCLSGRGDKDMSTLQQTLLDGGARRESARAHQRGHPQRPRQAASRRSSPISPPAFPARESFREHVRALAAAADVVEIGVPFTDPMADGVTIQRASLAALAQGVSLRWILDELDGPRVRSARRCC